LVWEFVSFDEHVGKEAWWFSLVRKLKTRRYIPNSFFFQFEIWRTTEPALAENYVETRWGGL
jgi:hypothetical protein